MFDVVTVGSGLIDIFVETGNKLFQKVERVRQEDVVHVPFGSKIMIKNVRVFSGGGGTNTAVTFAKFGLKTGFIGLLGKDNNADKIMHELKSCKVVPIVKKRSKKDNGFSVILDSKKRDRTILAYKGPCDELTKSYIPRVIKTKWFYFSSMLGKSLKTQIYLANYARKNHILIMFNPSPYVLKKGKKFLVPLLRQTEILIVNKEESGYITNGSIKKRLKDLTKLGPKIIIITEGKNGAYLLNKDIMYKLFPQKVKVLETTGAGDAFASGFLASYIKTNNIETSLRMALVNSQSVISNFGAKHKILTWKEALLQVKKKPGKIIKKRIK